MKKNQSPEPRRSGAAAHKGAAAQKTKGRCPVCDAKSARRFRPFCSRRCQDVDLGRWLRGSYRIPTAERPADVGPEEASLDENPADQGDGTGDRPYRGDG